MGRDEPQGFLWAWAEFGAHAKARCHQTQQWNGLVSREIVEAQGHEALRTSPPIGSKKVKLAAQAVAEAKRFQPFTQTLLKLGAAVAHCRPGLARLQLMVEARHIAPGVDCESACSQSFQQPSVAELGCGRQVTAPQKLDNRFGLAGPENPGITQLPPAAHA